MEAAALSIYSTAGRFEVLPPSAQAILGEYEAEGLNHGRRVYRRRKTTTGPQKGLPEVVLFFWDSRDGKDLSGWWLGDKVGGGKVWARNQDLGISPPSKGWRCPVDGPQQPHIVCAPRGAPREVPRDAGVVVPPRPAGAPPPWRQNQGPQVLVLSSKLGKEAPPATLRVVGQYVQQGSHHGKRSFVKKGSDQGNEQDQTVWLYYWDGGRDGSRAGGWWLGPIVGDEEVYGWARQHGNTPPNRGWRVPPDEEEARADLQLFTKDHEEEAPLEEDERLGQMQVQVATAEDKAEKAFATAASVLDKGDILEEGIRAVCEVLQARTEELAALAASLKRHGLASRRQGASENVGSEIKLLEERVQDMQQRATEELTRARGALEKVEREHAEEQGAKALEEQLPGALETVAQAELAVDNAVDDASTATAARELVRSAAQEVERLLEIAQGWAPEAQRLAEAEYGQLRERCRAAEERLTARDLEAPALPPEPDFELPAPELAAPRPRAAGRGGGGARPRVRGYVDAEGAVATRLLLGAAAARKRRAAAPRDEAGEEDAPKPRKGAGMPLKRRRLAQARGKANGQAAGRPKDSRSHAEALQDLSAELVALEARVAEAELLNLPLGDERQAPAEVEEHRASAPRAARRELDAWRARAAQAIAAGPPPDTRAELRRLLSKAEQARGRLLEVESEGLHWREPALCRVFLAEIGDAVARADHALAAAEEAEAPFLKGFEVHSMGQGLAQATLASCEAAAGEAGRAVAEAEALLATRQAEVAAFGTMVGASRARTTAALKELGARARAVSKRLAQYCQDIKDRRAELPNGGAAGHPTAAPGEQEDEDEEEEEDDGNLYGFGL